MNDFALVALYGAAGLWILISFARLHVAWQANQRQTADLRKAVTAAGLKLMGALETVEKLDGEIARATEQAAAAVREQEERRATLARSEPPPSPDIYMTSEYPTSSRDKAWVVEFMRDRDASRARQPADHPPPPPSLFWAPTQNAALDKGRHVAEAHRIYTVQSVRPLL
jgi:hypothetical protein